MSRRGIGILLLLACGLLLGLTAGEVFFRLFLETIPPLAVSSFGTSAAHFAYLSYGVGWGLVFFGWGLLTALAAPLFRRDTRETRAASATSAGR